MGDLEHSRVQGLMMAQNQPQHMSAEEMARRDKLERNRLSAQKCRAKRKAAARGSQERMANLTFDNAALTQENQRLRMLLAQAGIQDDTSVFDDTPRKRVKYETGITHSFDSSESAVFATTQQRFYLLAMMITILYSTLRDEENSFLQLQRASPQRSPSSCPSSSSDNTLHTTSTTFDDLMLADLSDFLSEDDQYSLF